MQRIVIKNFGPIKDVDIPIHDFMIFIGPQASGKSTIAKAIYFFREGIIGSILSSLVTLNASNRIDIDKKDIAQEIAYNFQTSWKYFPLDKYEVQFFYSKSIWIKIAHNEINRQNSDPIITFSDSLYLEFNKIIVSIYEIIDATTNYHGYGYPGVSLMVSEFLTKTFGTPRINIFIPAGRSVFSILANQIQLIEGDRVDDTVKSFAIELNNTRRKDYPSLGLDMHTDHVIQKALRLYREILKGSYIYDRQNDKIQLGGGIDIALESASSGQQESLWPLLFLFNIIRERESNFFVFEEPEAHLYPEAQKQITELITLATNLLQNQAIITTHSPYILSSLNNLLYAFEIGKIHPEKVEEVVDKNLWLDYDRMMAYFVEGGKVRSIMDQELRLIKSEEIDSASQIINREYDSLADIKFAQ